MLDPPVIGGKFCTLANGSSVLDPYNCIYPENARKHPATYNPQQPAGMVDKLWRYDRCRIPALGNSMPSLMPTPGALVEQADLDLTRRAIHGAWVSLFIFVVLAAFTSYFHEHPRLAFSFAAIIV